jgi:hypothetical protein
MRIKRSVIQAYTGILGWHTSRKLIVISSDDWGSIRVDSTVARQQLIKAGINMDSNRFDRFDMLESDTDMEMLFEVLLKHKDYNGNHPVITAVTNVANPDFEKIKQDNFKQYYYQNLVETHSNFEGHDRVYEYYKKGIELGIFVPQSHGREHLHVNRWMKALQSGHPLTHKAFEQRFFMLNPKYLAESGMRGFGASFDIDAMSEIPEQIKIVRDGLNIFESIFKYKATYFTTPAEKYNNQLNPELYEQGIRMIDVPKLRRMPLGDGKSKYKLHYIGQKNKYNQYYLTRNAVFEPNMHDTANGVDSCLNDIAIAFKWNKPVIISNHRAAFMGGLDVANRDNGLKALSRLLMEIEKRWPEIEYMSVDSLGEVLIKKEKK